MRVFFALDIAAELQYAIENWRDRSMRPAGRAVPAANFHITLHFLGEAPPQKLAQLRAEAGQINAPRFDLRLDTAGYFPAAGVFWLAPASAPAELTELARRLRRAGKKTGVGKAASRKAFTPHLTLFRGCRARPPLPTRAPGFDIPCDCFALFESIRGPGGVRYRALERWALQ